MYVCLDRNVGVTDRSKPINASNVTVSYTILDTKDGICESFDENVLVALYKKDKALKIDGLVFLEGQSKISCMSPLRDTRVSWSDPNIPKSYFRKYKIDTDDKIILIESQVGHTSSIYDVFLFGDNTPRGSVNLPTKDPVHRMFSVNINTYKYSYKSTLVLLFKLSYCDKHYYAEDREEYFDAELVYIFGKNRSGALNKLAFYPISTDYPSFTIPHDNNGNIIDGKIKYDKDVIDLNKI